MPFFFRDMEFCECGRPALPGADECRTCYEDVTRRRWREAFRFEASLDDTEPKKFVKSHRRELFAPATSEEEVERAMLSA